jgi:hypothetical protein
MQTRQQHYFNKSLLVRGTKRHPEWTLKGDPWCYYVFSAKTAEKGYYVAAINIETDEIVKLDKRYKHPSTARTAIAHCLGVNVIG